MSQNATPATEFAPCRHLTQPCQCDLQKTRNTTRLKCCACHENDDGHVQSDAPAKETATHLLTTSQKYCACHAKRLSTRSRIRVNVTKCHACHAKRSNDTSKTSKKDHLCKTSHRHGHMVLTRTVANGCARERNVERTHPQPPDPQSETGTLATHSGKMISQIFACSLPTKHPCYFQPIVPSGKLSHNYGKSPCYQWENSLFLWPFSIAMLNYQR